MTFARSWALELADGPASDCCYRFRWCREISRRVRSGRSRFRTLLDRGIHCPKVSLSFIGDILRQPPDEQSRERLRLLKTGAAGYGREVNAMCTVEDASNPYTATPAKVLFRTNNQNSRIEHHQIRSSA